MMGGNDLWDGENVLPPSDDYDNFRHELSKVVNNENASGTTDQRMRRDDSSTKTAVPCKEISHKLDSLWGISLYSIDKMPSYITLQKKEADDVPVLSLANPLSSKDEVYTTSTSFFQMSSFVMVAVLCIVAAVVGYKKKKMGKKDGNVLLVKSQGDYGSVERW